MTGIHDIPDEILIEIFSWFNLSERKNFRLVCQHWYRLSHAYCLVRNDVLVINPCQYLNIDNIVAPTSQHANIRLKLIHDGIPPENFKSIEFWQNCGFAVKSLTVTFHTDFVKLLPQILVNCPMLEYLYLFSVWDAKTSDSCVLDIPSSPMHFPNLSVAKILGFPGLILPLLTNIVADAPVLEKLYLYGGKKSVKKETSALLSQIFRKATKLRDIALRNYNINYDNVEVLVDIVGSQLTRVAFIECDGLSEASFNLFSDRCVNLEQLILQGSKLRHFCMGPAIQNMIQLTAFSMYGCGSTPYDVLCAIDCLMNLSYLSLYGVSNDGLCKALGESVRLNMTELHIIKSDIDDLAMEKILPNLPNLRVLWLYNISEITARSFEAICKHNVLLEWLSITNCPQVQLFNFCYPCSINDLKQLVHLSLRGEEVDKSIKHLQLPALKVLDYRGSKFPEIVAQCPSLKYWNLEYYKNGKVVEVFDRFKKRNVSLLKHFPSTLKSYVGNMFHWAIYL